VYSMLLATLEHNLQKLERYREDWNDTDKWEVGKKDSRTNGSSDIWEVGPVVIPGLTNRLSD